MEFFRSKNLSCRVVKTLGMDRDKFRSAVRLESAVSREERNAPDKADARYVAGMARKERLSVMQDWNRRWRASILRICFFATVSSSL